MKSLIVLMTVMLWMGTAEVTMSQYGGLGITTQKDMGISALENETLQRELMTATRTVTVSPKPSKTPTPLPGFKTSVDPYGSSMTPLVPIMSIPMSHNSMTPLPSPTLLIKASPTAKKRMKISDSPL